MIKRSEVVWNAVAATAFIVVIAAVAGAAAGYLALASGERLMEMAALLPPGWGRAHQHSMVVASVVAAVPIMVATGWWSFRRALAGEIAVAEEHRER